MSSGWDMTSRPLHKAFEKLVYCTMRMQYRMVYKPSPPSCKLRMTLMASLKSPRKYTFGSGSLHLMCQRSRKLEVRPTISAQSYLADCQSYLKMRTCSLQRPPVDSSTLALVLDLHQLASRSPFSGSTLPLGRSVRDRPRAASSMCRHCHQISGSAVHRSRHLSSSLLVD